jgi:hypothetical protein
VAVRLADGRTIFERASRAGVSPALVGPPIRFDADGDGRDEALITDGSELIVLDPTRDWGRTTVATDRALALAASATGPVGARQTRIVWLEPDPAAGSIQSAVVARVFDRIELGPVDRVASTTAGFERWSLMAGSAIGAAAAGAPATTWVGDVDTPACPTLVVPLAMQACGDEGLRPGAAGSRRDPWSRWVTGIVGDSWWPVAWRGVMPAACPRHRPPGRSPRMAGGGTVRPSPSPCRSCAQRT